MSRRSVALVFALGLIVFVSAQIPPSKQFGVEPDLVDRYNPQSSAQFQCLDGSGQTSWDTVNDDYCDCPDGSDEPATSACSNGMFYCVNRGYGGQSIHSTFVNDGVCDCCDGSDEWASGKCQDECHAKGAEKRARIEAEIALHTQGAAVRATKVTEAAALLDEKRSALTTAQAELAPLEKLVSEAEERKAPLEEEVKKLKEERSNKFNEIKTKYEEEKAAKLEELKKAEEEKQRAEGVEEPNTDNVTVTDMPEPEEEEYEKTQAEVDFEEAEQQFKSADNAAREKRNGVNELQEFVNRNYGPDNFFATYFGECHTNKVKNYDYEVCIMKSAAQKEAHSSTSTGRFEKFEDDGTMVFGNGQRCWQGPNRQTRVKFVCGMELKVQTVEEPETCKYEIEMAAPVACSEDHANFLRTELSQL